MGQDRIFGHKNRNETPDASSATTVEKYLADELASEVTAYAALVDDLDRQAIADGSVLGMAMLIRKRK